MKRKILSVLMIVFVIMTTISTVPVSVSAATSSIYTYTISNSKATITKCETSASGDIVIPDTLGGYPVTSIGDDAFYYCKNLTSINIPDSVTSIGYGAFSCCESLTSINIPDSVTSIGEYAFSYCTSLTSITIPDSVTSIEGSAFFDCTSLTSINIPGSVTSIGDAAFSYCTSLTSIHISDSVTSIGDFAFYDCTSLTSISLPDSVTSIGDFAFDGCTALKDVYYTGTEEDWNSISIYSDNDYLKNATIHYNYAPSGIKGRVYSSELETPIHNAVVYLYKEDALKGVAITDENGEYSFDADEGSYTVMVSAAYTDTFDMSMYQFSPVYQTVTVTNGNKEVSFDVEFPLYADVNYDGQINIDDVVEVKASYTDKVEVSIPVTGSNTVTDVISTSGITGKVYSKELEMPLSNALVCVYSDGLLKGVTLTDEKGMFTLDMGAGTYTLMTYAAYVDTFDMTMYQFSPMSTKVTVKDAGVNHTFNVKFPLYGDVNCDGMVNIDDAVEVRASYTAE